MTFAFPDRWPDEDPGLNPLSEALERRKAAGLACLDLTLSNPTRAGILFPEGWETLLGGRAVRSYDPDPRGSAAARAAIAAYYDDRPGDPEERGGPSRDRVDPDDLFLTAGTSEGYSYLFKLLCGPDAASGHALVPRPSYPLLETLADLENVTLGTYALSREDGWKIDRASLEAALTPRTRIVFVVHPNNPTGSLIDEDDTAWLLALAERRGFALVVDEVFADYMHDVPGIRDDGGTRPARRIRSTGPLVFTLNGLSKLVGLPQLKLAWIHVQGNATDKKKAKRHLEWMCDAFLSVGTAPQAACAELLRRRAEFQDPVRERIGFNLRQLRQAAEETPNLEPLWPQGGWCVPVRCHGIVEQGMDDEAFAIRLVEAEGVLVQPGYFFDFDEEDVLVLSLLTGPDVFREGLARLRLALQA